MIGWKLSRKKLFALGAWCIFFIFALASLFFSLLSQPTDPLYSGNLSLSEIAAKLAELPLDERNRLISVQRGVLSAEPLDKTALLNLTSLYRSVGEEVRADELTLALAKLSRRDSKAQIAALPILVERQDWPQVLIAADALIRTNPGKATELFKLLFELSKQPPFKASLVKLLTSAPPWRTDFIDWTARSLKEPATAYEIVSLLASNRSPPSYWETLSILRSYMTSGDFTTAYFVWIDLLKEADLRLAKNVFDGEFDSITIGQYFTWNFNRSPSVEIDTPFRATGSSDRILSITFVDNRKKVYPVFQLLRLEPGSYVLSLEAKTEELKSDSGLEWQIWCQEHDSQILAKLPRLPRKSEWQSLRTSFVVPANCETQQIALRAHTDASLDQIVSGKAFFDRVSLEKTKE
jgi:hypothetical protein